MYERNEGMRIETKPKRKKRKVEAKPKRNEELKQNLARVVFGPKVVFWKKLVEMKLGLLIPLIRSPSSFK